MTISLWAGDNTHFIEVTKLTLQPNGTLVNGATVQVSILKGGSPVAGYSDPITLAEDTQTDGRYTGKIPAEADLVDGTRYLVQITADTGTEKAQWENRVRATKRNA